MTAYVYYLYLLRNFVVVKYNFIGTIFLTG